MACATLKSQFQFSTRFGQTFFTSGPNGGTKVVGARPKQGKKASAFSALVGSLRPEIDDNPQAILSGEWPDNFSLLSFDDLRAYLEAQDVNDHKAQSDPPSKLTLGEVMSTSIVAATAEQRVEEVAHQFEVVSGLPVVDGELRCVGVISKRDVARASSSSSHGLKSKVGEVMTSPAITLTPNKTVKDAAAMMLKMKINRIPILNESRQVVGMVTRTDVARALEGLGVA